MTPGRTAECSYSPRDGAGAFDTQPAAAHRRRETVGSLWLLHEEIRHAQEVNLPHTVAGRNAITGGATRARHVKYAGLFSLPSPRARSGGRAGFWKGDAMKLRAAQFGFNHWYVGEVVERGATPRYLRRDGTLSDVVFDRDTTEPNAGIWPTHSEAQAAIDAYMAKADALAAAALARDQSDAVTLRRQVETLRLALRFYASQANYDTPCNCNAHAPDQPCAFADSTVQQDEGRVARAALAATEIKETK